MTTLEQLDKLIGYYKLEAKNYSDRLDEEHDYHAHDYYQGLLHQTNIIIVDLEKIKSCS